MFFYGLSMLTKCNEKKYVGELNRNARVRDTRYLPLSSIEASRLLAGGSYITLCLDEGGIAYSSMKHLVDSIIQNVYTFINMRRYTDIILAPKSPLNVYNAFLAKYRCGGYSNSVT